MAENPSHFDPRQYLGPARKAVQEIVEHKLVHVLGCAGKADEIIDRSCCRIAKAPQCFRLCDILAAHRKADEEGKRDFIDSASLMYHYGSELHMVEGPADNIKITTPADFFVFKAFVEARENSEIFGV